MFKKSLSIVLATLMLFSCFAVSVFANTEESTTREPVTYIASNRANNSNIVTLTANNATKAYTLFYPGDIVQFKNGKTATAKFFNGVLNVTYYPDADALSSVGNDQFEKERFDSSGKNNVYKDVLALSNSNVASFQDKIEKDPNETNTTSTAVPNANYTIKNIGDISTGYCDAGKSLGEKEIDFSFPTDRGEFLGWVATTATGATNANTLELYALWEKDARTTYIINYVDSEAEEGTKIKTETLYGYVGEEITVEPIEIADYTAPTESQTITLSADEENIINFTYKKIIADPNEPTVDPDEPSVEPDEPEEPKEESFVDRLKKKLITKIIDLICEIEGVGEVLDEELFAGMTIRSLLDMVIELGLANLIITLIPSLRDIIVGLVIDLL